MKLNRRQKLLTLIILSLTIIVIYKKTNNNNINYVNLGDGLAKGIDSYGINDYGYSDYFRDYLKETNKLKDYSNEFTNEEMTIKSLTNTLITNKKMFHNNKKTSIKEILRDADYLTISIGMNDLMYKLNIRNDYSEFNLNRIIYEIEKDFNELINEIKKVYPHKIYIIGQYSNNKDIFYKDSVKKLNNIYKNNPDVTYISTLDIINNKDVFFSNPYSYYPNYKGYKYIYYKMLDKITKNT